MRESWKSVLLPTPIKGVRAWYVVTNEEKYEVISGPRREACKRAEGDYRLMAAAPELLTLLQEARLTLEMWKDKAPAVSLCADIDAAIAKATKQ